MPCRGRCTGVGTAILGQSGMSNPLLSHPHLRFFADVGPSTILIFDACNNPDLLQQPAISTGHVTSGTLASSDCLVDSH